MHILFYKQAVCERDTKMEKGLLEIDEQLNDVLCDSDGKLIFQITLLLYSLQIIF